MKNAYALLSTFFFLFLFSINAKSENLKNERIKYFDPVPFNTSETLRDLSTLGMDHRCTFKKVYTRESKNGLNHTKYHQYYEGLPVLAGTMVVHRKGQMLQSISGSVHDVQNVNLNPSVNLENCEANAYQYLLDNDLVGPQKNDRLNFYTRDVSYAIADVTFPLKSGRQTLVYQLHVKGTSPHFPLDMNVLVDAHSGEVLDAITNIHTETITGHGDGFYHQNLSFNVDSLAHDHYVLEDDTRGNGIFVYNLLENGDPFTDEDNDWNYDHEKGAAVIEGYHGTILFYDFLIDKFNRNSIDNEGHELNLNVNRHSYVNAFWNGSAATFGNGNCNAYNPLTSYEVVAHEFVHGLTDFTSDLIYRNESGAINEALSDIYAKAFQHFYDLDQFDWFIGGNLPINGNASPFRSMSDPNERFDPKYYQGAFWVFGPQDAGGVHSNSGLLNHWFYLLVEGKMGTNEEGLDYNVPSIGMENAIQICHQMQTSYLTQSSNYFAAYQYSIASTIDLFGENSAEEAAVREAWLAVGIDDEKAAGTFLNLGLLYEGVSNSNDLFCPDVFENMAITFTNQSQDSIPANSIVNGYVVFSYNDGMGNSIMDTIHYDEQLLGIDVEFFEGFSNLISYELKGEPSQIRMIQNLIVEKADNEIVLFKRQEELQLNRLAEPQFRFYLISTSEECSEFAGFNFEFIGVRVPSCTASDNALLSFVYESNFGSESYDIDKFSFQGGDIRDFNIYQFVDIESLGPLHGITAHVIYSDNGVSDTLHTEKYVTAFGNTITEAKIYDMEDEQQAESDLIFDLCTLCEVSYSNEEMEIKDELNYSTIEDCLPFDEYYENIIVNGDVGLSTLSMCVDLTNIVDPVLTFDLKQIDNPNYSADQNKYIHFMHISGLGQELLDEPISSTGEIYENFQIPLNDVSMDRIEFNFTSLGSSTFIDNIGIQSGLNVGTKHISKLPVSVQYNNPVQQVLDVTLIGETTEILQMDILDVTGRVVYHQQLTDRHTSVNADDFGSGLYFMRITDGKTSGETFKFVKVD